MASNYRGACFDTQSWFCVETRSLSTAAVPLSVLGLLLLVVAGPLLVNGQTTSLSRRDTSPYKGYSGIRLRNDSFMQVYYHDQTVAVIELGPGKILLGCEFIEVYRPEEAKELLTSLRPLSQHITIRFKEMVQLMSQCDSLNSPLDGPQEATAEKRGGRTVSGFTVLSGILPGTKWCGLGDLAQNYHDLGSETKIDKCCRSHDICPAKVRAHDSRYDLKNTDFYTKSHCECDRRLYECLKATGRATADTMGSFYFNILRVPCVDDVISSGQSEDQNSSTTKIFRKARKRYRR